MYLYYFFSIHKCLHLHNMNITFELSSSRRLFTYNNWTKGIVWTLGALRLDKSFFLCMHHSLFLSAANRNSTYVIKYHPLMYKSSDFSENNIYNLVCTLLCRFKRYCWCLILSFPIYIDCYYKGRMRIRFYAISLNFVTR